MGNILGITDSVHSATQAFTYDNLSRLTSAVITGAGAPPPRYYTYDAVGNILSKDGISYSYNSTRPHAVTDLSDGSSYTYDANGNMQTRHTPQIDLQYLNYNTENRLTSIQDAFQNTIAEFYYDGDGGRIKKRTWNLELGAWKETTYIGSLYELRTHNSELTITKHIFKGATRLCSKTNSTNPSNPINSITYYHGDHLGSSNLLTDENGQQIKRIEYEPFGTSYIDSGAGSTNYRFTGKELDAATGLYYYGARYYDAKLGKFITADTIVPEPYNPQSFNRYSYCDNNPLRYTDPTGHSWKKFWKKVTHFFEDFGNFISPLGRAVVTGDWKSFGMIAASAVLSVVSFGIMAAVTPMIMTATTASVIALSAVCTSAALDTKPGKWVTNQVSQQIFDDALGMSPGAARVAGSIATYMAVNAGFQSYFGNAFTGGEKVTSKAYKYNPKKETALDMEVKELLRKGDGFNYFNKPRPFPGELEQVSRVLYNSDGQLVGAIGKSLAGQHSSIVLSDIPSITGRIDLAHFPNMSDAYGLWGTSHQAVNVSLLEAGYGSTIMSAGGGWTTAITTVIYGPYGGGAVGSVVAGVGADR